MSFDAREQSIQDGEPIELYRFTVFGTNYHFTTAAEDIVIGPTTYDSWPISRSEIEDTSELPRNNISVYVPIDFPIMAFFKVAPPSEPILLQIHRLHRGDTDMQPFWAGRVLTGGFEEDRARLFCENIYTSLKRSGLRRIYSKRCPHVLYGTACAASDLLHRVAVVIDGVEGIDVEASALAIHADGRFAGGFIEWEVVPGQVERRGIKSHVGPRIVLTHAAPNLVALQSALVYKGCRHTMEDCVDEFDNIENYGGFPYLPDKNPMGQNSVF